MENHILNARTLSHLKELALSAMKVQLSPDALSQLLRNRSYELLHSNHAVLKSLSRPDSASGPVYVSDPGAGGPLVCLAHSAKAATPGSRFEWLRMVNRDGTSAVYGETCAFFTSVLSGGGDGELITSSIEYFRQVWARADERVIVAHFPGLPPAVYGRNWSEPLPGTIRIYRPPEELGPLLGDLYVPFLGAAHPVLRERAGGRIGFACNADECRAWNARRQDLWQHIFDGYAGDEAAARGSPEKKKLDLFYEQLNAQSIWICRPPGSAAPRTPLKVRERRAAESLVSAAVSLARGVNYAEPGRVSKKAKRA